MEIIAESPSRTSFPSKFLSFSFNKLIISNSFLFLLCSKI